jgi:hypothetical protein
MSKSVSDITRMEGQGATISRSPFFLPMGDYSSKVLQTQAIAKITLKILYPWCQPNIYPSNLESLARCNSLHNQNALGGVSVRAQLDF